MHSFTLILPFDLQFKIQYLHSHLEIQFKILKILLFKILKNQTDSI